MEGVCVLRQLFLQERASMIFFPLCTPAFAVNDKPGQKNKKNKKKQAVLPRQRLRAAKYATIGSTNMATVNLSSVISVESAIVALPNLTSRSAMAACVCVKMLCGV